MLCLFVPSEIAIVLLNTLNHSHTSHFTSYTFEFQTLSANKALFFFKTQKLKNPKKFHHYQSMATSSSTVQESVQGNSSNQEAPAYVIKGRTMSLEEWDLTIQVERPVDFASLIQHGCDIVDFYEAQDLGSYFSMLNGPTYESLVKHFWVRASVYDKKAAKLEED